MTPDIDHQQLVKGTRMNDRCPIRRVNRRRFLQTIISSGVAAGGVWEVLGAELPPLSERPQVPDHTLVVVSGAPRARSRCRCSKASTATTSRPSANILGRLTRWSSIPPAAKPTSPEAPAAWAAGSSLPWASACQDCVFRRSS